MKIKFSKKYDPAADGAAAAGKFDAEAFKRDIMESNKQIMNEAIGTISSKIDAARKVEEPAPRHTPTTDLSSDPDFLDFKQELTSAGIDDDAAPALFKTLNKLLDSRMPKMKTGIMGEVKDTLHTRDEQQRIEAQVYQEYPLVLDKTSDLHKIARLEFNALPDDIKKSPMASSISVRIAAGKLGIKPYSREDALLHEAGNPTGGSGGGSRKSNEPTKEELSLADEFGIDSKVYSEKLKLKLAPKR